MSQTCPKRNEVLPKSGVLCARLIAVAAGAVVLGVWPEDSTAALVPVPNASFESQPNTFVSINIDSWQKAPKPEWYIEDGGFLWHQLIGAFNNTPPGSSDHIENCDGSQAIWLFAVPEVALFQDYETVDWNDPAPSHAFDAVYTPGKAYQLQVGIIGTGGGMQQGVTLALSLYYRDAASNRVHVSTTMLTNVTDVFSNNTRFVDCEVNVPTVSAGDAWAGRHIGIEFTSTVSSNLQGGYWDLDNVRLWEIPAPTLAAASWSDGQFQFTLRSAPGLRFEILATTNLALPVTSWISLGEVTNLTGDISFSDPVAESRGRFYQARQLP